MFSEQSEFWHDRIELTYGPVTPILSKAIRSQFISERGKTFYGGDFSNIEGRLNAWFAGEQWKLDAFRDADSGGGYDLYNIAYAKSFGGSPESLGETERQIGKTQELAFGYQGSVGAWLRFDPRPDLVTRISKDSFGGTDAWRKASEQFDRSRSHLGLTPDQWIAIKVNVNSWREANSRIVQSWWDLQDAALQAVDCPGHLVNVLDNKVGYMVSDGFLWCRLPSGKLLAYAKPGIIEMREEYVIDENGEPIPVEELTTLELHDKLEAGAKIKQGRTRMQVTFEGTNQKTRTWGRQYLYGGLQTNNIVQGTARELLRFAMHNIEDAGYPIVLHVHDETLSEVDEGFGNVKEYAALMSIVPPWLEGLPLTAKAWTDKRYVK